MLKSRINVLRRAALLGYSSGVSRQMAVAMYSSIPESQRPGDIANYILQSSPEELKTTKLTTLQSKYLKTLGESPKNEDIGVAFEIFNKILSLNRIDRFSCARLTLMCLNNGLKERVLEPWTRLLESLNRDPSVRNLQKRLNRSDYEPAAMAALASYFIIAGPAADSETALKLVPRSVFPSSFNSLRSVGGIQSPESEKIALKGLANMLSHLTNKFSSPDFLEILKESPFGEVSSRWKQVNLALTPQEIPEECYAAFIQRFADTKQTNKSFEVWQQLVNSSNLKISISSWAALLRAAANAPSNSLAIFSNLWDRLLANGYIPNAQCYAEKLRCLVVNGKYDQALNNFQEMQEKSKAGNMLVNTYAINVITTSLARRRKFKEIDAILAWAAENKIKTNGFTFNPILEASAHDGELVQKYFIKMAESGVEPDIATYTFAVERNLKLGIPVGDLLAEMNKANIKPNAEFDTALAYRVGRDTKDLTLAREVMEKWKKERQRVNSVSLGAFIELELKYGDVDRAVEYSRLTSKFGLTPSVPMFNQLIRGSLKRQRFDVALSTLEKLVSGDHRRLAPNKYTFMHMIDGWTLPELQGNKDLQQLIRTSLGYLVDRPNLIDYALAERIARIQKVTGSDLVPDALTNIVSDRLLELYNRRLTSNS